MTALVWFGPVPLQALERNAAEAALHVAMVCLAAPLLAAGAAGSRADPVMRWPAGFSPLALSLLQWAVVWAWHAPAIRLAARSHLELGWLQNATILLVGVLLWLSVLGGGRETRYERVGAGIIALLLTSVHMTLLGGLSLIGARRLHGSPIDSAPGTGDQTLGALLTLGGAAIVYATAGILLIAWLLRPQARAGQPREPAVTTANCRS